MPVKPAFRPLLDILEEDPSQPIDNVLQRIRRLCEYTPGKRGRPPQAHKRDEQGRVTHIFCSYHKKWEPLVIDGVIQFPVCRQATLGYKPQCKEGYRHYTARLYNLESAYSGVVPRRDGIGSIEEPTWEDVQEVSAMLDTAEHRTIKHSQAEDQEEMSEEEKRYLGLDQGD